MPNPKHDNAALPAEAKDREDIQNLVQQQVEEAWQWREQFVEPQQELATDYYRGEAYGDEREGRSQVRTSEVRDGILSILPSLMKVYTSSERAVEFDPVGAEDVALASQQTDYVNHIFYNDNPGVKLLYSTLKDALARKLGVMKWGFEENDVVEGSEHTGLTAEAIQVLESDPYATVEVTEEYQDGTFDVRLVRKYSKQRVKVWSVPPEEFLWSPSATCIEDASMVAHVRDASASELVTMGVPRDLVDEHKGKVRAPRTGLKESRRIDDGSMPDYGDVRDDSMEPVQFAEVYVWVDGDGDDEAELHRVQCIGQEMEVWEDDIVDHIPFALFEPDPEPHTLIGMCPADYLMDIQRINSHILRGMLDSLVAHVNPAMEVVEDEVNMKDVLNQEIGRIIRTDRPGMIREIPTQFVGAAALPVLEYTKELVQRRIGISDATNGLGADALQSTTRAAVTATVAAAQQRLELMALLLAETGLKTLFKGILRTVVQHQDQARTVRLRGEWVPVDPRQWDADKDVRVNVALGTGMVEQKVQMLAMVADKQELHIQQGSPLGSYAKLRETYRRILELLGHKDVDSFWPAFTDEQEQQMKQAAQENKPPSETEVLQQIEMAKIQQRKEEKQQDAQLKLLELQLKREALTLEAAQKGDDARMRTRQADVDGQIRAAQLALQARSQQTPTGGQ